MMTKVANATGRSTRILLLAVDADNSIPDLLTFGASFEELPEVFPDIRGTRAAYLAGAIVLAVFLCISFAFQIDWVLCGRSSTGCSSSTVCNLTAE